MVVPMALQSRLAGLSNLTLMVAAVGPQAVANPSLMRLREQVDPMRGGMLVVIAADVRINDAIASVLAELGDVWMQHVAKFETSAVFSFAPIADVRGPAAWPTGTQSGNAAARSHAPTLAGHLMPRLTCKNFQGGAGAIWFGHMDRRSVDAVAARIEQRRPWVPGSSSSSRRRLSDFDWDDF